MMAVDAVGLRLLWGTRNLQCPAPSSRHDDCKKKLNKIRKVADLRREKVRRNLIGPGMDGPEDRQK
jgi:hypothetical protein